MMFPKVSYPLQNDKYNVLGNVLNVDFVLGQYSVK